MIVHLQCCNYSHRPNHFHLNFNHPWQHFSHRFLAREGGILANRWTHPSSMTIFVCLFIRSVIQKVTIVALNIIFSVVYTKGQKLDYQYNLMALGICVLTNFLALICSLLSSSFNTTKTHPPPLPPPTQKLKKLKNKAYQFEHSNVLPENVVLNNYSLQKVSHAW